MATGLERALKTVDIKGKAYVTVNECLKYFREHFTGYKLISDIVYNNEAKYLTWDRDWETLVNCYVSFTFNIYCL